jgi:ubiquitin carboxyl-terminal hydrolase 7
MEKLFSGTMTSYIKCVHVNCEVAETETFYGQCVSSQSLTARIRPCTADLSLDVEGMKTLRDSLCKYVAVEAVDEYVAGRHGPQVAVKGISFSWLPPVLHMQLKHSRYDFVQDRMVKVSLCNFSLSYVVFKFLCASLILVTSTLPR